jgi:Na+-driven multidrug efflux pump
MIVLFSLLEMIILLSINHPLLNALSSPIKQSSNSELNLYYQKTHDLQIKIASQLTIVYAGCLLVPMLMTYFGQLIKSEGRFKIVATVSIVSNIANIAITSLLVLFAKTDGYSAPISAILCQTFNLVFLLLYLSYLNKNKKT